VTIRARRGSEEAAQEGEIHAGMGGPTARPQLAAAPAIGQASDTLAAAADPLVFEVVDSGIGLSAEELLVVNEGEAFTQVRYCPM
jgi:hypothetical protein